jgi:hypothetical protein
MHWVAFDAMIQRAESMFQQGKQAEVPALFEELLAAEKYGSVKWQGYQILANIHGQFAQMAAQSGGDDDRKKHEAAQWNDWIRAWPFVPETELTGFGAFLAGRMWERRETLSADEKAFALGVGQKIESKAEKETAALDAVACCYFINGKKEDALKLVRKCIELEPTNADFKARLTEFGG